LFGLLAPIHLEAGNQPFRAAIVTNSAPRGAQEIITAGTANDMALSNPLHNPKGVGT
jgi:hypothetical protein